ncbi:MAG: L-glutamate gamma-semialdehyde dehydrogenase [Deltaproteobacteria bacterium]|nr:L-glutamate gamma-semialdehyde dehydrogenase [Deltaproteobacteria bacterium]
MIDARVKVPHPVNEPVLSYAPGSPERAALKAELARQSGEVLEIPMVIGGERVTTGEQRDAVMPHRHAHVIGRYHWGETSHMDQAIAAAQDAREAWMAMPLRARSAIFLKAADLLAGPWRQRINASTMLGQSKTAFQAEIDAACELADFFRFNAAYAEQIHGDQPGSVRGLWDQVDYRPLDGFVLAVTPFNFTSIAANLCAAPALMGNTVVWKPSLLAMHSAYQLMLLFEAAGVPPGVINLVTGDPASLVDRALESPDFAGLHFTGSTAVLKALFGKIGERLDRYRAYPRIVGESGGKDFIVVHPSAKDDLDAVATAIVRGGFELQGQKCSAASRCYVPRSMWPALKARLIEMVASLKMGDVADFRNFMGAVIGRAAFDRNAAYQEHARSSSGIEVVCGGNADDSVGYFVEPTIALVEDPQDKLMAEEIFGPIVGVHLYDDDAYEETLALCDATSPYALTGAVFSRDRGAIEIALRMLRHAAGNFYINDKPTGAVVGQQPFGGSRASGTNDKAGSAQNLLRWVSPRTIKETFVPPVAPGYPFMDAE